MLSANGSTYIWLSLMLYSSYQSYNYWIINFFFLWTMFKLFRSEFIWSLIVLYGAPTSKIITAIFWFNTFVSKIYKSGFIGSTWLFYFHQIPIFKCISSASACIFVFWNRLSIPHFSTQISYQKLCQAFQITWF